MYKMDNDSISKHYLLCSLWYSLSLYQVLFRIWHTHKMIFVKLHSE